MADPVSPADGQFIDDVFWDVEVFDRWNDYYAGWTAYTPTWLVSGAARSTIGNGTLAGKYKRLGRTVFFQVTFVWGTTTTIVGGTWEFNVPVAKAAGSFIVGWAHAQQQPCAVFDSGAGSAFFSLRRDDGFSVSDTVPSSWSTATNKTMLIQGIYEVA